MAKEREEPGRFEGEDQHGWSPDIGSEGEEAARGREKAMGKPSGERGEGREVSEEELSGTSATEREPGSPFGVGESTTRSPEDQGGGGTVEGHKGPAQRPYGRTDDEDTGVGKEGKATEDSPDLPSGDQGG